MNEVEKLLWMFNEIHGPLSKSCYLEVVGTDDDSGEEPGVNVMKGGFLCWNMNKTDLVFEYLTRHLS